MLPRFLITVLVVSVAGAFPGRVGTAQDANVPKKPATEDTNPVKEEPRINEQRIAELTELIEDQPDKADGYRMRAIEYARGQAWGKAAADFLQIAQLEKGGSQLAQKIGVLLVLAQDKKTHQQLCEEMLEVFSQTNEPGDLERTAKICTLMPESQGDLDKLLKLATEGLERGKDRIFVGHHYRTKALVFYRMNKYEEAVETIHEGDKANENVRNPIANITICNRAIEAMCLVREGKRDEAKKVLAKGTPILEKQLKNQTRLYQDDYWHDWLIAKVLHDEAQQLIEKTKD